MGLVGRDTTRAILFAEGKFLHASVTPHLAEMLAIREGIKSVVELGWSKSIIESDTTTTYFSMDAPAANYTRNLCSTLDQTTIQHYTQCKSSST